jgi:hypothetical protein
MGMAEGIPPDSAKKQFRFEATVHAPQGMSLASRTTADLDVDRVPGPQEEVRVLADVHDLVRLLDQGMEVRLHRAVPVQPLAPNLVMDDEGAQSWLDQRVRGI